MVNGIGAYLTVYILIFAGSVVALSFDGFDLITTFTAVATCFNNVGPGLEIVGPMGSFADFSPWCKWLLSFDMLAGRLELFPMLALFSPRTWRPPPRPAHGGASVILRFRYFFSGEARRLSLFFCPACRRAPPHTSGKKGRGAV